MPNQITDTPPPELRELVPKLARHIAELDRLRTEASAARQAAAEAEAAIARAEAGDRQAAADHHRGLRKAPRPSAPQARQALTDAEAKAAGLEQAATDAEADLRIAITEHRDQYAAELDRTSERGRERSRKAATKLAELEADRAQLLALRRWLDDGRYAPGKSRSPSVDLKRRSGEPYTVGDLLPLIESALAPAVERPKPEARPLRRVTV